MFFVSTLLTLLLVTVSSVNASDDVGDGNIVTDTIQSTDSHGFTTYTNTISSDNKQVSSTKNKELKKDDNIPESNIGQTKDVSVNNYDELISAINNASNDANISECTINLNEGTYDSSATEIIPSGTLNENVKITINGNNQTLTGQQKSFYNKCLIIFNDLNIQHNLVSANGTNFTFQNTNASRITSNIGNSTLTINNSKISSIEYKENSNINIINSTVSNYVSCRGDNSNTNETTTKTHKQTKPKNTNKQKQNRRKHRRNKQKKKQIPTHQRKNTQNRHPKNQKQKQNQKTRTKKQRPTKRKQRNTKRTKHNQKRQNTIKKDKTRIQKIFKSKTQKQTTRRFKTIYNQRNHLEPIIKSFLEKMNKNLDKLINHIENKKIPSTNNIVENYTEPHYPENIKEYIEQSKD